MSDIGNINCGMINLFVTRIVMLVAIQPRTTSPIRIPGSPAPASALGWALTSKLDDDEDDGDGSALHSVVAQGSSYVRRSTAAEPFVLPIAAVIA